MSMYSHKGFRGFTLFAFTISTTISIGLAFLPFISGEEIRSSWLKLILGSGPYFLYIYLLYRFTIAYNSYDFLGVLKINIWNVIYWLVSAYWVISILFAGGIIINGMSLIIDTFLLPETPQWGYLSVFMVVSAIAVYYGIEAIGRFVTITIFFDFLILFIIVFLGFSDFFRWVYIPPLVVVDPITMAKGAVSDMARYGGLLPLLGFLAFVKKSPGIYRAMNIGLLFVMVTYVTLSIVVIGTFGFEQSINLVSPFISLIQSFKGEAVMFERLDLFFLSFWLYGFFKIYTIHIWFLTYIFKRAVPSINQHVVNVASHAIVFVLVMLIPTYMDESWRIHNFNMILFSLVIPILLLLFLLLKKRNGERQYET